MCVSTASCDLCHIPILRHMGFAVAHSAPCGAQAETGMTYDGAAIRKWFLLGGDTCPLTGLRVTTTKVWAQAQ